MRRIVIAAAAVGLLALSIPASAATPTSVSGVSAAASGSSIGVTGTVAFGGQDPVTVGEDSFGDALIGQGLGLDLGNTLISQPNPAVNNLQFQLKVDGFATGGIPEGFQYNWDISVDGGAAEGGTEWSIKSMRSGQGTQPANTGPWAALTRCVPDPGSPTGGFTCSTVLPLLATTYDATASEIRIIVPLGRISASPGSKIEAWARNGSPVWVRTSAAGALTGFVTVDDTTHDEFIVPAKTVELGIAQSGDPIVYSATATVSGTSFTGSLPKPSLPGTYDVAARACFGTNCATEIVQVTI